MSRTDDPTPIAILATDVPPRTKPSNYPEPFFSRMAKRQKRQLGDVFGLSNFGVNLTRIAPGGESALLPPAQPAGRVRLYPRGPANAGYGSRRGRAVARACAPAFRQAASPISWSTAQVRTWSMSRLATAPQGMREAIPMTTSRPCSVPTESGFSRTRTARLTEPRASGLTLRARRRAPPPCRNHSGSAPGYQAATPRPSPLPSTGRHPPYRSPRRHRAGSPG